MPNRVILPLLLTLAPLAYTEAPSVFEQYGGLPNNTVYNYNHSRIHSKLLPVVIYNSEVKSYLYRQERVKCKTSTSLKDCPATGGASEGFEWPRNDRPSNKIGIEGIQKFFRDFERLDAKLVNKQRYDASSIDYVYLYHHQLYDISWSGANGDIDLSISRRPRHP